MPVARRSPVSASARQGREDGRPIASALGLPEHHVQLIEQSHERCAALGLSRIERPDFSPLGRADLHIARERNLRLHTHAAPVMEMLFGQIVNTESMVVLCDAAGTVIHSIGDDDFLARASKIALAPGVNWSEPAKGTNAVGTALVAEAPTLVHADEHFLHANDFLTCSATPIFDPRGNILGVLDVSGDRRSYHPHTMALVKMSARMIENHWLADDFKHAMRLHFHSRAGYIGTLMEGILAVAPDGRIVGANRGALEELRLPGSALRMHSLQSLFGVSLETLVDRFRFSMATPMLIQAQNGRSFHLQARFNWPVVGTVAEATSAHRPPVAVDAVAAGLADGAPPPGEPRSLAQLQTGDAAMDTVVARIRRVLDRDIPIVVSGDTGTGKDLLARAIHADSARADKPFVVVRGGTAVADAANGADAAPANLASHVRQAREGTVYFDEVADLTPSQQLQLLHLLQDGLPANEPGAPAQPLNVAIVCSTCHDLRSLVASGRLRQDVYFRLAGLAVRLPTLRERSDLVVLAQHILDGLSSGRRLSLGAGVIQWLREQPWPGNVRELGNVLRSAALMAGGGGEINMAHLPDDGPDTVERFTAAPDLQMRSLGELELDAIRQALAGASGNVSAAAKRLGVSRNTVYRRLQAAKLEAEAGQQR